MLCVDLIGTYTEMTKHEKELTFHAITMCDPETGCKTSKGTAKLFDKTQLCCYPCPKRCISDNRNKCPGTFLGRLYTTAIWMQGDILRRVLID